MSSQGDISPWILYSLDSPCTIIMTMGMGGARGGGGGLSPHPGIRIQQMKDVLIIIPSHGHLKTSHSLTHLGSAPHDIIMTIR